MTECDSFFDTEGVKVAGNEVSAILLVSESQSGYCRIHECVRSGRRLIVKSLKPEYAQVEIYRDLLRKEYEIASSLYHPGIVQVFGFEDVPELGLGILMEYVDGVTLDRYVASGVCGSKEARAILSRLCAALSYIHSRQIVHRDLKPANIIVSSDLTTGKPKRG